MFSAQINVSQLNENLKADLAENLYETSTWWPTLHLLWDLLNLNEHPWALSVAGSVLVGLSGILPLLIIPLDYTADKKTESM